MPLKKIDYSKYLYTYVFFMLFCLVSQAQEFKINHGPYLQYLTTDEVTIIWTTTKNCISWVEFYEEDGSHFYQKEREKVFSSLDGLKTINKIHRVRITGLKPSTRYAYRIYSKEVLRPDYNSPLFGKTIATQVYKKKPLYFTTLSTNKKHTSCFILSDIHEKSVQVRRLLKDADWNKIDFVVFNGDFINSFYLEATLFEGFIDTCTEIFAKEKPFYIVRGNHETRGSIAPLLKNYFYFPQDKYYYTFSSGSTLFIVLDCGEDKPDSAMEYNGLVDFNSYRNNQAKWLQRVVKSQEFKNSESTIVFIHIPPFTERRGNEWYGQMHIREKFIPILNSVSIDLMVCGHTHKYTYLPKNKTEHNFPIIICDNNTRIDLHIDDSGIKVIRIDGDSKILSQKVFIKRKKELKQ
jgi:predicted phosphodiesterase